MLLPSAQAICLMLLSILACHQTFALALGPPKNNNAGGCSIAISSTTQPPSTAAADHPFSPVSESKAPSCQYDSRGVYFRQREWTKPLAVPGPRTDTLTQSNLIDGVQQASPSPNLEVSGRRGNEEDSKTKDDSNADSTAKPGPNPDNVNVAFGVFGIVSCLGTFISTAVAIRARRQRRRSETRNAGTKPGLEGFEAVFFRDGDVEIWRRVRPG